MRKIFTFTVVPSLPPRLQPLLEIAYNLWWSWNPEAIELFRRVDTQLWDELRHNPVLLLGNISPERLEALSGDEVFLSHMERARAALTRYMEYKTWFDRVHGSSTGRIGYFSLEFGLHECLPLYSGGLGILAGDHMKSASELGLPLLGVGLAYRHGYFRQFLNRDGWQKEVYEENDFYNMPMTLALRDDDTPCEIEVPFPEGPVRAQIWRINVGRTHLFMLDTNLDSNSDAGREITAQLYGGDVETRIRQEVLLGVGGIRALSELGLAPRVCHMNEGHSAFLALERILMLMRNDGLPFEEAKILVTASNIFTTHTPVPAGNDVFPAEMITRYFSWFCKEAGISPDTLLNLGRQRPGDASEPFSMPVAALRLSAHANGVSKLHGEVSRKMWRGIWPEIRPDEIPIIHITNGIHTRSWLSSEISRLYDRYLGPQWHIDPEKTEVWKRVANIPDSELWRSHERLRERLIGFSRRRLREQLERRGVHHTWVKEAEEALDPEALTIGFARRFASYKRATLLLWDRERLARLVGDAERPVQFIFAGKAHPRDNEGKEFIRQVIHSIQRDDFRQRIVFLEDYDIMVARYLVQGVDVWLNNPRRPLEASGTSGMKVPPNGGINLSVLDGWWCEGFSGDNGWAIGSGEEYDDHQYQDEVESQALYDLLEREVVPLFYRRGSDGLPREWIAMMKSSMMTVCPEFNTNRMIEQYTERFYQSSLLQWNWLSADKMTEVKQLTLWRRNIVELWKDITVHGVETDTSREFTVGQDIPVRLRLNLGRVSPEDVQVEILHGKLDAQGMIVEGEPSPLTFESLDAVSGVGHFSGMVPCRQSGQNGFSIRVLPYRIGLNNPFELGLVLWW
jgi:starch phosphorylase